MPTEAPLGKIESCKSLGAQVELIGDSVEDAVAAAMARALDGVLVFVPPYDDEDVVAGQGTLGLELLDDVSDLGCVVVPVGGGGLASGVAIAVKSARADVRVVGVQIDRDAPTIADGIAVKRPGAVTGPLLDRWLDDLVTVSDEAIAEAMVVLMEKSRLVVEGAGAVGVAALLGDRALARGTTCVVLSGGNVDAGLLAMIARRHETASGRRLVFVVRVPDRPRALARLLDCVGETGANLLDVVHLREGFDFHVRETAVQVVLETRGREHAAEVLDAVLRNGYEPRVLGAATSQSDPTER
jgi:threonine dehydratase